VVLLYGLSCRTSRAAEHALNGTRYRAAFLGVPPSLEDCDRLLRKAR
jgi:hypothetical protein